MVSDLAPAERRLPKWGAMRIADLGRNLRLLNEVAPLGAKPFAQNAFARSAAICVCCVKPSKPNPPRMIEQLQGLFFAVARAAQFGRRANSTEVATAKDDAGDVGVRQNLATSTQRAFPTVLLRSCR
jgi:hypothetical protein